ncbi:MAG: B12-binding domain-containing radical SAM protein [Thermoplasmata archaeon]|nr:B12-binding domain-containing radical SAM protein [Thermoplasmata archaeon]
MPGSGESRSPRVLLVDPYLARDDPMERRFVELYPSLGILTLAAYLRARRIEVAVVDLTFARDTRPVSAAIRKFAPDIVGVHTKTLTIERALAVGRLAHAAGAYTVAGGPDAATRPETYLASAFDAVALAEGEETLTELARCVGAGADARGIAGLAVRRAGRVVRGPPRPFLPSLDDLPLPAWDMIDLERYLSVWQKGTGDRRMAVLTSRGCPFDCAWCSKPTFGRSFRQQSVGRVVEELRALRDRYHVDYVRFCDDVFGIQRSWLEDLLDRMLGEELGLRFECLARVDLLKPDLLARMRRAGLERVYVGVESGSQRMLDTMNRGTKLSQVERAAEALRAEGIRQFWFLMLGYPGETMDDIEATLKLFRKFSPEEYSVSIAVPVPGTRFYEAVKDRLTRSRRPLAKNGGGRTLLYEAVYPESLYRWSQARFELAASLSKVRGKLPPPVLDGISGAADALHHRVVTPILLGRKADPPVT